MNIITEVDASGLVPHATFDELAVITWAPSQEGLTACEVEHKMYCILLRTLMFTEQVNETYKLQPSTNCLVFIVKAGTSDEQAEQEVKDLFMKPTVPNETATRLLTQGQSSEE